MVATMLAKWLPAWHIAGMHQADVQDSRLHRRLIDSLYIEAMVLADEARSYFDEAGRDDRDTLDPLDRVAFSCESLKVTTRLMHVIAWLLTQRAVQAGELRPHDALHPSRRLGEAPVSETRGMSVLPQRAGALIAASAELHRRVGHLDAAMGQDGPTGSAVHGLQQRLAMAF